MSCEREGEMRERAMGVRDLERRELEGEVSERARWVSERAR